MKRNTLFGAAGLLVAGAAIGAGAVVSQNAMASDGQMETADALTMINISDDGTALQCTFTGADIEGLVPAGIPTDDVIKGQMVVGVGGIVPADGTVPMIDVDGATIVGGSDIITGSIAEGAVPVDGVITVGAGMSGELTISGTDANGDPIVGPETREGTAEECAAMRDQALADMADMQAHVDSGTVISVSAEAGVITEP